MTSPHPVLTIGFQIAEALIQHRGLSRAAAKAKPIRLLEKSDSGGEIPFPRISTSVLRRIASA